MQSHNVEIDSENSVPRSAMRYQRLSFSSCFLPVSSLYTASMVGSSKEGQEQFEIHRSQGSDRLHALRLVLSRGVCRFHDAFRVGLVCKFGVALQAIRAVRDQCSRLRTPTHFHSPQCEGHKCSGHQDQEPSQTSVVALRFCVSVSLC